MFVVFPCAEWPLSSAAMEPARMREERRAVLRRVVFGDAVFFTVAGLRVAVGDGEFFTGRKSGRTWVRMVWVDGRARMNTGTARKANDIFIGRWGCSMSLGKHPAVKRLHVSATGK